MRTLLSLVLLVLALVWLAPWRTPPPPPQATFDLRGLLDGPAAGFARADQPRRFIFPRDYGPHARFRSEWWYFTGNLGHGATRYGYELTFFRRALPNRANPARSAWSATQVFMADLAITGREFHAFDRFERGSLGLAGATTKPFAVWVDDWRASGGTRNAFPIRLHAYHGRVGLDLVLRRAGAPVLQGDRGLSRKGPHSASYYYSVTRIATRGTLLLDGHPVAVSGNSWMDREWTSQGLPAGVVGWDWFGLQLADGRDLMFYRLRRKDGRFDRYSAGSLVGPHGHKTPLSAGDVKLQVTRRWGVYPVGWKLRIPRLGLHLRLRPLLDDQELRLRVPYWEGAVTVSGSVEGRGYVELVGYR